jgi:hypothetical protein
MQTLDLSDMLSAIKGDNNYRYFFREVVRLLPFLDIEHGPWLAGGSVRRLFDGSSHAADFDIFFTDEEQMTKYRDWLCDRYDIAHISSFNYDEILLPVNLGQYSAIAKLQLVKIYGPTIDDILQRFDYSICQLGTDGDCLVAGNTTFEDIQNRLCRPACIQYAKASMRRMLKFAKEGYEIDKSVFDAILAAAPTESPHYIPPCKTNIIASGVWNMPQQAIINGNSLKGTVIFSENLPTEITF